MSSPAETEQVVPLPPTTTTAAAVDVGRRQEVEQKGLDPSSLPELKRSILPREDKTPVMSDSSDQPGTAPSATAPASAPGPAPPTIAQTTTTATTRIDSTASGGSSGMSGMSSTVASILSKKKQEKLGMVVEALKMLSPEEVYRICRGVCNQERILDFMVTTGGGHAALADLTSGMNFGLDRKRSTIRTLATLMKRNDTSLFDYAMMTMSIPTPEERGAKLARSGGGRTNTSSASIFSSMPSSMASGAFTGSLPAPPSYGSGSGNSSSSNSSSSGGGGNSRSVSGGVPMGSSGSSGGGNSNRTGGGGGGGGSGGIGGPAVVGGGGGGGALGATAPLAPAAPQKLCECKPLWLCTVCTYENGNCNKECAICTYGKKPTPTPGAASSSSSSISMSSSHPASLSSFSLSSSSSSSSHGNSGKATTPPGSSNPQSATTPPSSQPQQQSTSALSVEGSTAGGFTVTMSSLSSSSLDNKTEAPLLSSLSSVPSVAAAPAPPVESSSSRDGIATAAPAAPTVYSNNNGSNNNNNNNNTGAATAIDPSVLLPSLAMLPPTVRSATASAFVTPLARTPTPSRPGTPRPESKLEGGATSLSLSSSSSSSFTSLSSLPGLHPGAYTYHQHITANNSNNGGGGGIASMSSAGMDLAGGAGGGMTQSMVHFGPNLHSELSHYGEPSFGLRNSDSNGIGDSGGSQDDDNDSTGGIDGDEDDDLSDEFNGQD